MHITIKTDAQGNVRSEETAGMTRKMSMYL